MKMKKDNRLLIIGIVVVVILGIITYIMGKKDNKTVDYAKMTEEEVKIAIDEKLENIEKNKLSELGERERIEHYISSFISAIEQKKYEDAYEMLYDDFKKNYFPTLESFEEYAKTKIPSMISLKYDNIERNDNVYIVWLTMSSALSSDNTGIEMNFVVRENELNDYDISFSVK